MGKAKEHKIRMAYQVLLGDRLRILVDQLEQTLRSPDGIPDRRRAPPGDDEDDRRKQHQPGDECAEHKQQTRGAYAHPKHAMNPARIVSKNTAVP